MSALGLPKGTSIIAAHADYCREHYRFSRMQSGALRVCEWEKRARPIHSWSEILLLLSTLVGSTFLISLMSTFL